MKIKVEKKIHKIYEEWANAKKEGILIRKLVGKWQYIYSSKLGKISLVKFINYSGDGKDFWEIYCFKGNLFQDVERYPTKKEAEKRINYLLNSRKNKIKKWFQKVFVLNENMFGFRG